MPIALLWAWLALPWIGCSAFTEPGEEPASGLEIPRTRHSFGSILPSDSPLRASFPLINRSDEPIRLEVLGKGCSCLEVHCPEVIEPGKLETVSLDVEVGGREGYFATSAKIGTSDPAHPQVELTVAFEVIPGLRVTPARFEFNEVKPGEVLTTEFETIQASLDPEGVEVPTVQTPGETIQVTYLGRERPDDGIPTQWARIVDRFRLRIETTGAEAAGSRVRLGELQVTGRVKDHTFEKRVPLTARFREHPGLHGPRSVLLRSHDGRASTEVTIAAWDDQPFAITRIQTEPPWLKAEPVTEGRRTRHTLRLRSSDPQPAAGAGERFPRGRIELQTDAWPDQPYRFGVLLVR